MPCRRVPLSLDRSVAWHLDSHVHLQRAWARHLGKTECGILERELDRIDAEQMAARFLDMIVDPTEP